MNRLVLFCALAGAIATSCVLRAETLPAAANATVTNVSADAPVPSLSPTIRFEDATDQSGIDYVHSFGSAQLGSLLEGTGAGCVWFDYNNSGLPSLYVVNGRPLDDSMHPHPAEGEARTLHRTIIFTATTAGGHFTDVTR
jgi:hypothetical protein